MIKRRKHRHSRRPGRIVLILSVIVAVVAALIFWAVWMDRQQQKPENMGDYRQRYAYDNIIEVGGVSYRQRKDLTTILLMGIDQDHDAPRPNARSGGQADFLRLVVIDPENDKISQLALDRDTMTPITVLGIFGDVSSTRTNQLCLAHGYGDGKEQSCEFTVKAVSNLLLGTEINHYAAMNLDGIPILNDWAGGVTVTLEDDFSEIDPAMTPGTNLTLVGDQAETFVRSRMSVGDGTNASRMQRQQQYLEQFSDLAQEKTHGNKQSIGELYDALEPYLTTNMSRGRIINLVWGSKDYEVEDIMELPGTHIHGDDGHTEYHVNEEDLQQIVLEMFYEPIK